MTFLALILALHVLQLKISRTRKMNRFDLLQIRSHNLAPSGITEVRFYWPDFCHCLVNIVSALNSRVFDVY